MTCIAKRRGRYIIDFYDTEGKRRWKTLPQGTTKAKAKEFLREIEDRLARQIYIPDEKLPIFSLVAKNWIETTKHNLRESTWSVYEGHTRNHFDELNSLRINRITTPKIETFISNRLNEGMHILTLRKILVTLNQIMAYAVRHKYIDYNPVREAQKPRGKGTVKEEGMSILTPLEINTLLAAVKKPKYRMIFKLAVMSGARQGEILGLKWQDIDWENNQIHIRRTYNNGRWYDVKTPTSNRRIDIGPLMMADLLSWRASCEPNADDLVFAAATGQPINHTNMRARYFYPALESAGIRKIRFHDLRHTYASLLIEQGENIKYIQTQLGHSSPTVTLNVYAHLFKQVNQEAARRLENVIFETSGSRMVAETKKDLEDAS